MIDCSNASANTTREGIFDITPHCKLFDFSVYSVGVGLLVVLGLIGNVISFVVLWSDNGKTATVFLLRSLAIADSLVLISVIPLYVLPNIGPHTGYLQSYADAYPDILHFLWPCYLIPYTCTIMLTVLVSLNRYFCVCKPFTTTKICSTENAHKHVVYVALFSIVYNIPRFFEYQEVETCIGPNISHKGFDVSPFGRNKIYRILYSNVLYFIVMHGGPLLSLAFLNSQLIKALKKRQKKRALMGKSNDSNAQGYQHDVTMVLVVVICVFMCCQTPTFVDHLLWTFLDAQLRYCGNWLYYYTAIGDLLAILNSSINFVIYTLTSQKFRKNLTATCTNDPDFQRLPMTVADNQTAMHTINCHSPNPISKNSNKPSPAHV